MNRKGYFAAGGGGGGAVSFVNIGSSSTDRGPSGNYTSPAFSLSEIPHVPGKQRLSVFTYVNIRGDSNSSIVTSAQINGRTANLLSQSSNDTAGAHTAISWLMLNEGDTTAQAYFNNNNNVNYKGVEGWVIQGKNPTVHDQQRRGINSGSTPVSINLTTPVDNSIAFICCCIRNWNASVNPPTNWEWTFQHNPGTNGRGRYGRSDNIALPAGTHTFSQSYSSTTGGRHMSGIIVGEGT